MYCPKCHHEIPDQAHWCRWCGAAQPGAPLVPLKRRRSGAGVFVALLLCAVAAVIGLKTLPTSDGFAQLLGNRGSQTQGNQAGGGGTVSAVQEKGSPRGSAGYLWGDVLLVSIYVDDADGAWRNRQRADVRDSLRVACDFLEEEAAAYGAQLELYYDVQEYPELAYKAQFSGQAAEDRNGAFDRWIYRWISSNIPVAELQESFGTDNVGFLVLLAGQGSAYTNVYYMEDPVRYYNESSVLFYKYPYEDDDDREVPGVYAHEILHMFGAIDLYEGSSDFSPENTGYVAQTYPNDIMYSDYVGYDGPDYTQITLEISPVTAYYLGWLKELPQADQEGLSDYGRVCVAGFSYDDPTFGEE